MNNYKNEKNLEIECQKAYEILKEALKNKKINDSTIIEKNKFCSVLDMFEVMDLQNKNCKLEKAINILNTEIDKLKKINDETQTEIKGLVRECNELYTENQEMLVAIDLKDKEILELKNKRHNYTLSNLHYQKKIDNLERENKSLKEGFIHEINYKESLIHNNKMYEENYKNLLNNFNKSSIHLLNELTTPFTLVGKL